MAIQLVRNWQLTSFSNFARDNASATLDAAGESVAVLGRLQLPARTGSKVLSAAGGGKIFWRTGASVVFANAGTNVDIGVQDVGTTLEDGTYDVVGNLVGGTDTIASSSFQLTTMETGTKTIAHNDLIAIVITVVARAGADSLVVRRVNPGLFIVSPTDTFIFPYGTVDTGTLAVAAVVPFAAIVFDDGTVGWIQGVSMPAFALSTISYNSGSTPDEYIATFTLAAPMQIAGIGTVLSGVAAADTLEVILYSDPYGTPTVIEAVTPNLSQLGGTNGELLVPITPVTLSAATVYGVAVRPTTANNISWNYADLGSGMAALKELVPLPDIKMSSRSNQTGAFAETDADHLPLLILDVCGLDDAAGGAGGGMLRHPSMNGGLNA